MAKYRFTYEEKYIKTEWESESSADFNTICELFDRMASAYNNEGFNAGVYKSPTLKCCGLNADVAELIVLDGRGKEMFRKSIVMGYGELNY